MSLLELPTLLKQAIDEWMATCGLPGFADLVTLMQYLDSEDAETERQNKKS